MVEVRSDKDGYQWCWYTTTVIGSAGVGKFLVEYKTLTTDDETTLLREVASKQDIRPYPPQIHQGQSYRVLQEVDAWYNDGWWEGVIAEVLEEWKYSVYFASTNEKLAFWHSYLRPHQNWVHGKWVLPLQERPSDLKLKATPSERKYIQQKSNGKFQKGALVEVKGDKQGYERSWTIDVEDEFGFDRIEVAAKILIQILHLSHTSMVYVTVNVNRSLIVILVQFVPFGLLLFLQEVMV
ncbi:hypothetical protein Cgig2_024511 [Carnegiea gigantea]|uniref:Agenet domain-containing protein n=1 Tax=Carnegiea gigantea TaxID=171969 RepID=A0A9Q1QMA0_9CARY|nr:hypothetical protein Cgig2_024511 [Carnegiea gigantea]